MNGPEDPGADGSNPDGSNPDGSNPDGRNPDGRNPDGRNPDGSDPDGSDPPLRLRLPGSARNRTGHGPGIRRLLGSIRPDPPGMPRVLRPGAGPRVARRRIAPEARLRPEEGGPEERLRPAGLDRPAGQGSPAERLRPAGQGRPRAGRPVLRLGKPDRRLRVAFAGVLFVLSL
ncbi:MAG: hypothetical protein QG608_3454, partial [Actinomycetota bacterium]|nr:hypothetical protein [Actinomycetota bacterium]